MQVVDLIHAPNSITDERFKFPTDIRTGSNHLIRFAKYIDSSVCPTESEIKAYSNRTYKYIFLMLIKPFFDPM